MERDDNYNGLEKAESSEEVLMGGAVDNFVYHCTRYKRSIENYSALKKLLEYIFSIDFLQVYYKDDEKKCEYIRKLREDIENKAEGADAKKQVLKNLDPSTEVKAAIIIENLLNNSEKKKCGIGVINEDVYFYNECYWEVLDKDFVRHYLSLVAEKSGLPHFQTTRVKFMDLLYKQLISAAALPPQIAKDKDVKINLKNGTFKCSNGKFEICPFSADDRLTYQLPFDYDPNAKADKFLEFLEYAIPEKEARTVIAEYVGYIFAKHLRWEKCLVLLGSGGNGKSVLIDIITALLGAQNVCHFSLNRLCEANGYHRAELSKYLLNACSEMGSKNSDPEMVKQLFSNDPVGARSPYGKPITVSNYCRFLFSANFISNKDMEQTFGFFRRFAFIEFNSPVPEEKKNPNLAKEIIEDELSGVFNWALDGLKSILQEGRKGFTYSAHIENMNKTIEKNSNSVALFMEEKNYEPSATKYEEAKNLYREYADFCESYRYGTVSKQEFLRRLETQLHFHIKRKATNNATWVYCQRVISLDEDEEGENVSNLIKKALMTNDN